MSVSSVSSVSSIPSVSDAESSSEDEVVHLYVAPRIFRQCFNLFEEDNDNEFKLRFRMSKQCVLAMSEQMINASKLSVSPIN